MGQRPGRADLIADGQLEVPIANVYPDGASPRGLHRARTPPPPRQDRPQALDVGGTFKGAPLVLVHHRGRKSGREYVNPVMYLRASTGHPGERASPMRRDRNAPNAVNAWFLMYHGLALYSATRPSGPNRPATGTPSTAAVSRRRHRPFGRIKSIFIGTVAWLLWDRHPPWFTLAVWLVAAAPWQCAVCRADRRGT